MPLARPARRALVSSAMGLVMLFRAAAIAFLIVTPTVLAPATWKGPVVNASCAGRGLAFGSLACRCFANQFIQLRVKEIHEYFGEALPGTFRGAMDEMFATPAS